MEDPLRRALTWHHAAMPDATETLYARTLRALQDASACPACTRPLHAGCCTACGLDVSGPAGLLVWQDSQAVVRALAARQERVAALRASQSGRVPATQPDAAGRSSEPRPPAVRGPAAPPAAVPARPAAVRAPVPHRAVPAATAPAARPARPVPVTRAPRPAWRVQTVLQVVGASLLVAASITFLVFAWDVMGLRGRAAVVAVGTLVVFALASWLRTRRLTQGAEALGAIAVVLLLLDAWALRATDVLAIGGGAGQAGVSALVCGAVLTAWGTRSRLRVGAVAGAALVALAPLAWLPAVPGTAGATFLLLAAGTIAAVRAVPPWSAGRAERAVLRGAAGLVLPAAVITALVGAVRGMERGPWVHVALLGAITLCLALQVAVEARTTDLAQPTQPAAPVRGAAVLRAAWAASAGVVAGLTGAGTLAAAVAPATGTVLTAQAAVVGLCMVTAGLLLAQRTTAVAAFPAAITDLRNGALAGLSVAAGAALLCALVVVMTTAAGLVNGHRTVLDAPEPGAGWALGLVSTAALGIAAARLTHGGPARVCATGVRVAVVLVAVTAPVLLAVGPLAHLVVVAGEAGVVVALLAAGGRSPLGLPSARAGAVAAAVLGVLGALPDPGWTAAALLAPAAVALLARTWSTSPWSGAVSTSTAAVLLLAAGAAVGPAVGVPAGTALAPAAALVGGALLVRAWRRAATPSRVLERDAALLGAAAATVVAWASSVVSVPGSGLIGSAAALVRVAPLVPAAAALVLVVALLCGGTRWGPRYVAVGAGAAAPVAAVTVATVNGVLAAPGTVGTALLVTVVGTVALGVAPTLRRTGGEVARRAAEVSGALVATTGVLAAAATGPGAAAVALLLAAVGAAVWALAAGRSWAWWVVLVLATPSWWLLLGLRDVVVAEPYTVAPSLVVAAVGAWRVARGRAGAPVLLVAGLAVGTVPTAVLPAVLVVGERWVDRGLLAAGAAAALVTVAALLRRRRPAAAELVAGLGAVLLVIGPLTRAVTGAVAPSSSPTGLLLLPDGTILVELWSWPAAVALAVCAATIRTGPVRGLLDAVTPWALLAAASVPTLLAVGTAPASASAVARVSVLGAGAVTCALIGGATGRRVRAPGAKQPTSEAGAFGVGLAGLGLVLATAVAAASTSVVAARSPAPVLGTALDLPVLVTGLVVLTTAALAARRSDVPVAWVAGGVLMLVPSLLIRSADARLLLWCAIAAVLLVLAGRARTVPGTARRSPTPEADVPPGTRVAAQDVPRLLAGTALGVVVAGPWAAALAHSLAPGTAPPWRVELVAILAFAVGLHHARVWRAGPVPRALRTTLVTLLVLPSLLAVDAMALGTARGVFVLIGGGALAWWSHTLLSAALGVGTATLATVALAVRGGPEPADLPWTVLGILTLALGVRRMTQNPEDTSWRTLGVPLSLTLGAPLAALTADPAGWRVATVLTLGITTVVVGAVRRWQAPFVLGAAAVLVALAVVLSPVAVVALADVDGWVLLAVGGALVLGLGLTYERRVQDAREAVRFVGEMR